ncbi:hypothetical protein M422DRAFT_241644 [Sphaerobolus stellatus SS14]|nr:hypothetical protein M422DRAFT_241644 [Sphaerobolus stellatus SS14]
MLQGRDGSVPMSFSLGGSASNHGESSIQHPQFGDVYTTHSTFSVSFPLTIQGSSSNGITRSDEGNSQQTETRSAYHQLVNIEPKEKSHIARTVQDSLVSSTSCTFITFHVQANIVIRGQ